jgi:hypothetical protein
VPNLTRISVTELELRQPVVKWGCVSTTSTPTWNNRDAKNSHGHVNNSSQPLSTTPNTSAGLKKPNFPPPPPRNPNVGAKDGTINNNSNNNINMTNGLGRNNSLKPSINKNINTTLMKSKNANFFTSVKNINTSNNAGKGGLGDKTASNAKIVAINGGVKTTNTNTNHHNKNTNVTDNNNITAKPQLSSHQAPQGRARTTSVPIDTRIQTKVKNFTTNLSQKNHALSRYQQNQQEENIRDTNNDKNNNKQTTKPSISSTLEQNNDKIIQIHEYSLLPSISTTSQQNDERIEKFQTWQNHNIIPDISRITQAAEFELHYQIDGNDPRSELPPFYVEVNSSPESIHLSFHDENSIKSQQLLLTRSYQEQGLVIAMNGAQVGSLGTQHSYNKNNKQQSNMFYDNPGQTINNNDIVGANQDDNNYNDFKPSNRSFSEVDSLSSFSSSQSNSISNSSFSLNKPPTQLRRQSLCTYTSKGASNINAINPSILQPNSIENSSINISNSTNSLQNNSNLIFDQKPIHKPQKDETSETILLNNIKNSQRQEGDGNVELNDQFHKVRLITSQSSTSFSTSASKTSQSSLKSTDSNQTTITISPGSSQLFEKHIALEKQQKKLKDQKQQNLLISRQLSNDLEFM